MRSSISLRWLLLLALCHSLYALSARAQSDFDPTVTLHQLTPQIYWAEGNGGNSGILIGAESVTVIDAKMTPQGATNMLEAIHKLTPKPVRTVILTHSDVDHINGLTAFPAGITILAHENDLKEQQEAIKRGGRMSPSPDRLPTKTVGDGKTTLSLDGFNLELWHWGPAHTSGDLVVFLPSEKILFAGDILTLNLTDPLIHLEKHGSPEGWLTTDRAMLALGAERIIPGHGSLQTPAQLMPRLEAATAKYARIVALIKQGKTLDQIKAEVDGNVQTPVAGTPHFPPFSETVYQAYTAQK